MGPRREAAFIFVLTPVKFLGPVVFVFVFVLVFIFVFVFVVVVVGGW